MSEAYFVVLTVEGENIRDPHWSYRGRDHGFFAYVRKDDEIDTPEKAARLVLDLAREKNVGRVYLDKVRVGLICDVEEIRLA